LIEPTIDRFIEKWNHPALRIFPDMAGTPKERSGEIAEQVWRILAEPAFAFMRDHFSHRISECHLSPAQATLLRELDRPTSQRELARRLGYDPSNITALADGLEERGLVERQPDPTDRRIRALARTPEGERVTASLEQGLFRPPEAIARLSPAEQRLLLRLLRKVFGACH
jgi:DNA-binding MarR family transcriptional regulator